MSWFKETSYEIESDATNISYGLDRHNPFTDLLIDEDFERVVITFDNELNVELLEDNKNGGTS